MDHKELNVWKESMKLVKDVYVVMKNFPDGICSQMRRSSVSIPSNISEGAGRNNIKENIQFCRYSQGSLSELETQLLISADLNYIDLNHPIFDQITTVKKLLSGYINHLLTSTH